MADPRYRIMTEALDGEESAPEVCLFASRTAVFEWFKAAQDRGCRFSVVATAQAASMECHGQGLVGVWVEDGVTAERLPIQSFLGAQAADSV